MMTCLKDKNGVNDVLWLQYNTNKKNSRNILQFTWLNFNCFLTGNQNCLYVLLIGNVIFRQKKVLEFNLIDCKINRKKKHSKCIHVFLSAILFVLLYVLCSKDKNLKKFAISIVRTVQKCYLMKINSLFCIIYFATTTTKKKEDNKINK